MSKKKLSRRKFLKSSAVGSAGLTQVGLLELLFSSFIAGKMEVARADSLNLTEILNYVHFSFRGGTPRWQWDCPLTPNGTFTGFNPNPYCINKFSDLTAGDVKGIYATHEHNGLHVPYLWASQIPTSNGGKIPMSSVLDNTFMFRGLNNTVDGHYPNRVKMNNPVPGGLSLTGLAADLAQTPIPAVHYGDAHGYKSSTGVGTVSVSGNLFESLLDGLSMKYRTPNINLDSLAFGRSATQENSSRLDAILNLFKSTNSGLNKVPYTDLKNAKKVFLRDFGDLAVLYAEFVAKYEDLIQRSFAEHDLPGVDDQAIPTWDDKRFWITHSGGTIFQAGHDLRDIFVNKNKQTVGAENLTAPSSQRASTIQNLAASMALAEFCITNDLATSLMLPCDSLSNLYYPSKNGTATKYIVNGVAGNDSHWTGCITSMYVYSKYYKAVSACTNELKTVLKSKSVGNGKTAWDRTLLHYSSEFNRAPDANGLETGHGWQANTITLVSGMIDQLQIIGNCKGHSRGHWGVSHGMSALSGRDMLIGNIASSVSELLGSPSPTPNDSALIGKVNGKAVNYSGDPEDEA